MNGVIMNYLQLILQRPIENLPPLIFMLVGFFQVAKLALNLFSTQQNLQAGQQAITVQDNTLQSKLIEFMGALQKQNAEKQEAENQFRAQDLQFRKEMLSVMKEVLARVDNMTARIDGTTLATSADVKAIAAKLDRFDRGFGYVFKLMKAKGVI